MSGCGKTVLTSTVLEHVLDVRLEESTALYFFFDFSDARKQQLGHLLRSLAFQLYSKHIEYRSELDTAYTCYDGGVRQIANDTLLACLTSMLSKPSEVTIILDALDECTERTALLQWIERHVINSRLDIRLLLVSKDETDIRQSLSSIIRLGNAVEIEKNNIASDISTFIHGTINDPYGKLHWRCGEHPTLLNEVETTLRDKSDGM